VVAVLLDSNHNVAIQGLVAVLTMVVARNILQFTFLLFLFKYLKEKIYNIINLDKIKISERQ
jgi:hypothetical protein